MPLFRRRLRFKHSADKLDEALGLDTYTSAQLNATVQVLLQEKRRISQILEAIWNSGLSLNEKIFATYILGHMQGFFEAGAAACTDGGGKEDGRMYM